MTATRLLSATPSPSGSQSVANNEFVVELNMCALLLLPLPVAIS